MADEFELKLIKEATYVYPEKYVSEKEANKGDIDG
jgi:hypothetical protein